MKTFIDYANDVAHALAKLQTSALGYESAHAVKNHNDMEWSTDRLSNAALGYHEALTRLQRARKRGVK